MDRNWLDDLFFMFVSVVDDAMVNGMLNLQLLLKC